MIDRVPQDPGRVKMTRADGTEEYVTIERADNPVQEGTPLNTENMLPLSVGALYGLGEDGTVADAFKAIPDWDEWCFWYKQDVDCRFTDEMVSDSKSSSIGTMGHVGASSSTSYYSDGIEIVTYQGALCIQLVDQKTLASPTSTSALTVLRGKYVTGRSTPIPMNALPNKQANLIYVPNDAEFYGEYSNYVTSWYATSVSSSIRVITDFYAEYVAKVASSHGKENQPDGYDYVGSLADCGHIEWGSYTGTGTSGSSNPTTITLERAPKFVIIGAVDINSDRSTLWWCFGRGSDYYNKVYFSMDGTTFSWYSTSSAGYQMNLSGYTYVWFAIA